MRSSLVSTFSPIDRKHVLTLRHTGILSVRYSKLCWRSRDQVSCRLSEVNISSAVHAFLGNCFR